MTRERVVVGTGTIQCIGFRGNQVADVQEQVEGGGGLWIRWNGASQ